MLDFPDNPNVGDLWPTHRPVGGLQWEWDGERWILLGFGEAGPDGMTDAPEDGKLYGREMEGWTEVPDRIAPPGVAGVSSFNTRTGAVTFTTTDRTNVGAAPLVSPTFTGTPTVPTPASRITTTQIINGAFMDNYYLPFTGGTLSSAANPILTVRNTSNTAYISTSNVPPNIGFYINGPVLPYTKGFQCRQSGGICNNCAIGPPDDALNFMRWYPPNTGQPPPILMHLTSAGTPLGAGAVIFNNLVGGTNTPVGNLYFRGSFVVARNLSVTYSIFCDNFVLVSDERIKEHVAPSTVDALGALNAIEIVQYDIKQNILEWMLQRGGPMAPQKRHSKVGVVSQQVQEVIPDLIGIMPPPKMATLNPLPDDMQGINTPGVIPYLVRAIQQLTKQIEELEAR